MRDCFFGHERTGRFRDTISREGDGFVPLSLWSWNVLASLFSKSKGERDFPYSYLEAQRECSH
jgi:hypothetical protein